MSSVKISELPSLSVYTATEVFPANSGNTTYKVTPTTRSYTKELIITPPTGCTLTVNGSAVSSITGTLTVTSPWSYQISVGGIHEICLTNNTDSSVPAIFSTNIDHSGITSMAIGPANMSFTQVSAIADGIFMWLATATIISLFFCRANNRTGSGVGNGWNSVFYIPANGGYVRFYNFPENMPFMKLPGTIMP